MPWMWYMPSKLYGFEEMGFVGVGLWVVLVSERWFWWRKREMGLWVLIERKRGKRDFGGGGGGMEDCGKKKGDGVKRNGANLDLIVCGTIFGFICKMFT